MRELIGPWYDVAFLALLAVNVVLIVLAWRSLSAATRIGALTRFVLALAAVFVPFVGPLLALVVASGPAGARQARSTS